MKRYYTVIVMIIIVFNLINAQSRNVHDTDGTVLNTITQITHSHFGKDYIIRGYEVLDSILVRDTTKDYVYNSMVDFYGTLARCVIFWIEREQTDENFLPSVDERLDTSIVCICRNGELVWNSGSMIKGTFIELLFCFELNRDGKVEIGIISREFRKNNFARLYIIGWDGVNGTIINDLDSASQSAILSEESTLFQVFDIDGDGIYEIRGCYPDDDDPGRGWFPDNNPSSTSPYITYGWDGIKYGYSPSVRQVGRCEIPPMNRIKLHVKAMVTKENDKYKYTYRFKSDSTSKQLIVDVYIKDIDSISTIGCGSWNGEFTWVLDGYNWSTAGARKIFHQRAGEERSGAGFLSIKLPGIKDVYAQGDGGPLDYVACSEMTDERIINDVLTNSYHTKTIGPSNLPDPFIPVDFLDTLKSYTTQSRSLGWIKYDATADKYLSYFNSAKISLEQNNVSTARAMLNNVLNDVNVDSTNALTSEAYALLRFNTEYFLTQIPERPEQPQLTVSDMLDTLLARLKWCYDNKQLGDRKFYAELADHIRDAIRKYQRQDTIGTAQEIEEFYTKLRWEYQRKPKKNDRRSVSGQAYQMLYPLARQIEAGVITLPPRPTGTVVEQLSALKSQIRREAEAGNIGGGLLIRELERMLERGTKAIQRKDTLQTKLSVELYLETVRNVYEHSTKKIYLKAEGYISLYYRGRYVLETVEGDREPREEIRKKIEPLKREGEYEEIEQELKAVEQ